MPDTVAVHENPVWRERSDFVIAAKVPDGGDIKTEQLWARRIEKLRFEICSIPFFVYDVALGDIVETDADYVVRQVLEPSGRFVFRVWFGESRDRIDETVDDLKSLGAVLEWSSPNLLAVDAVDADHAKAVADSLHQREQFGQLTYETGRR